MSKVPDRIAEFLKGKRIAVAGVSRNRNQAANFIFRKLRDSGYEVLPVNPNASEVEGIRSFPDVASIPGELDGLVVATHPEVSAAVVRQGLDRGLRQLWFHRSFGTGSVSEEAVRECRARGVEPIVGACPLMYCEPVDVAHRCVRWWLGWRGQLPK